MDMPILTDTSRHTDSAAQNRSTVDMRLTCLINMTRLHDRKVHAT